MAIQCSAVLPDIQKTEVHFLGQPVQWACSYVSVTLAGLGSMSWHETLLRVLLSLSLMNQILKRYKNKRNLDENKIDLGLADKFTRRENY